MSRKKENFCLHHAARSKVNITRSYFPSIDQCEWVCLIDRYSKSYVRIQHCFIKVTQAVRQTNRFVTITIYFPIISKHLMFLFPSYFRLDKHTINEEKPRINEIIMPHFYFIMKKRI